jgi:prepilin-type processing-associated H-X9-DG protein
VSLTSPKYTEISYDFYDTRHNNGATLLFCDGHAKWRKKSAILISEYGLKPKVPNESMEQVGSNDVRDIDF